MRPFVAGWAAVVWCAMAGMIGAAEPGSPARLLAVTVTTGFRHSSIPTAEAALEEMGRASGLFHVDWLRMPPGRLPVPKAPRRKPATTDEEWLREQAEFQRVQEAFERDDAPWQKTLREQFARAFAAESLAAFDGVMFVNTTGDLPIPDLPAFLDWVAAGKAFVGLHAATDTFRGSDEFCRFIGGIFAGHPWNATGEHAFVVHEPEHRLAAMFPARFRWRDEIYQYDTRYDPGNVRVLVSLDMPASTPREPWHVPVSWVRESGKGRIFYTNFGHNEATWREPMFRRHIEEGVAWALGRFAAPAAPNPRVQAAEYLRSVIAAAAAAGGRDADELLAKADAKAARDPDWPGSLRPELLAIRALEPAARGDAYARILAEVER